MSVSLYKYTPACDGEPCPGDCDLCRKENSMDDLISRQAAINMLFDGFDYVDNESFGYMLAKLKTLPSAQPEIIRCKDCKHGMYDVMLKFYWCHGEAHSANWFCADGERREDE